jgi:hypothetical protein
MSEFDDTGATPQNVRMVKAELVSVLSDRIRAASGDARQLRGLVYELARTRLMEQFEQGADTPQAHQMLQILESAIREVETTLERAHGAERSDGGAASPPPLPLDVPDKADQTDFPGGLIRRWQLAARSRSFGPFGSIGRLALILIVAAGMASAALYWRSGRLTPAPVPQGAGPAQEAAPQEAPQATPAESNGAAAARPSGSQQTDPAAPRPTTYGVYALSEGQLQELKPLAGKVPDRRVAISAAVTTPSQTTLANGDVKFIVFRPDQPADTSGPFEVRVVAKVARAMGVDSTGKASTAPVADSWVIRNVTFPYKAGPADDQQKMLQLQPETDGFSLGPGRYVVVIKGIGYDFTVAGDVTDPNQCVERINATNGAFYSPCPPR